MSALIGDASAPQRLGGSAPPPLDGSTPPPLGGPTPGLEAMESEFRARAKRRGEVFAVAARDRLFHCGRKELEVFEKCAEVELMEGEERVFALVSMFVFAQKMRAEPSESNSAMFLRNYTLLVTGGKDNETNQPEGISSESMKELTEMFWRVVEPLSGSAAQPLSLLKRGGSTSQMIPPNLQVLKVAGGEGHWVISCRGGLLLGFGNNGSAQLGFNPSALRQTHRPLVISEGEEVLDFDCKGNSTGILYKDRLVLMGGSWPGGKARELSGYEKVVLGGQFCLLYAKEKKDILVIPHDGKAVRKVEYTGVMREIVAGNRHFLVRLEGGDVLGFGDNKENQLSYKDRGRGEGLERLEFKGVNRVAAAEDFSVVATGVEPLRGGEVQLFGMFGGRQIRYPISLSLPEDASILSVYAAQKRVVIETTKGIFEQNPDEGGWRLEKLVGPGLRVLALTKTEIMVQKVTNLASVKIKQIESVSSVNSVRVAVESPDKGGETSLQLSLTNQFGVEMCREKSAEYRAGKARLHYDPSICQVTGVEPLRGPYLQIDCIGTEGGTLRILQGEDKVFETRLGPKESVLDLIPESNPSIALIKELQDLPVEVTPDDIDIEEINREEIDNNELIENNDSQDLSELNDLKELNDIKNPNNLRHLNNHTDIKDHKDLRDLRDLRDHRDHKDLRDHRDLKDLKDHRDHRILKGVAGSAIIRRPEDSQSLADSGAGMVPLDKDGSTAQPQAVSARLSSSHQIRPGSSGLRRRLESVEFRRRLETKPVESEKVEESMKLSTVNNSQVSVKKSAFNSFMKTKPKLEPVESEPVRSFKSTSVSLKAKLKPLQLGSNQSISQFLNTGNSFATLSITTNETRPNSKQQTKFIIKRKASASRAVEDKDGPSPTSASRVLIKRN